MYLVVIVWHVAEHVHQAGIFQCVEEACNAQPVAILLVGELVGHQLCDAVFHHIGFPHPCKVPCWPAELTFPTERQRSAALRTGHRFRKLRLCSFQHHVVVKVVVVVRGVCRNPIPHPISGEEIGIKGVGIEPHVVLANPIFGVFGRGKRGSV